MELIFSSQPTDLHLQVLLIALIRPISLKNEHIKGAQARSCKFCTPWGRDLSGMGRGDVDLCINRSIETCQLEVTPSPDQIRIYFLNMPEPFP